MQWVNLGYCMTIQPKRNTKNRNEYLFIFNKLMQSTSNDYLGKFGTPIAFVSETVCRMAMMLPGLDGSVPAIPQQNSAQLLGHRW